jgi:hypothetical protein
VLIYLTLLPVFVINAAYPPFSLTPEDQPIYHPAPMLVSFTTTRVVRAHIAYIYAKITFSSGYAFHFRCPNFLSLPNIVVTYLQILSICLSKSSLFLGQRESKVALSLKVFYRATQLATSMFERLRETSRRPVPKPWLRRVRKSLRYVSFERMFCLQAS